MVGLVALAGAAGAARADVAAVFADGHGSVATQGGPTNADGTSSSATGVGFRLGARLLIFEGYYDYTGFGRGTSVGRGILGVRGGFGTQQLRLVLRAGAGVIEEEGGALTGRGVGTPDAPRRRRTYRRGRRGSRTRLCSSSASASTARGSCFPRREVPTARWAPSPEPTSSPTCTSCSRSESDSVNQSISRSTLRAEPLLPEALVERARRDPDVT